MSSQRSVLSLVPLVRAGEVLPGGGRRARREFLEFEIDGVRLGDVVRGRDVPPTVMSDVVSVLATDWPDEFLRVQQLLGQTPPELADGRLALYVCPECGDLGCGGVTVVVDRSGDDVVWRDLGWQTDCEPDVDFESFVGLGPFPFDRSQYEAVLSPLLHRAEAVADPSATRVPARRRWFRIPPVNRGWRPSRRRG